NGGTLQARRQRQTRIRRYLGYIFSSLLEPLLFVNPHPMIQWPLSSVQPQLNLPPPCKTRRGIDVPFRCRARDQNGCDLPLPRSTLELRGAREAIGGKADIRRRRNHAVLSTPQKNGRGPCATPATFVRQACC